MRKPYEILGPGGFTADQVPSGSPYELVDGHPVVCLPTGRRGSVANLDGGMVIATDPAVKRAGVDLGVSPSKRQLRAPDVAVLADDEPDAPGWAKAAPPLAVEYADTGQDEGELSARIAELLAAGTRFIWVVRLDGIRRVEVHTPDAPPTLHTLGQQLTAPGVLQNPVPVEALFFHDAAQRVALRNLLQREGYADLDEVRAEAILEGREEGKAVGILEGRAEGREEGHAVGILEGREEGKAVGILEGREEGHAVGILEGRAQGQAVGLRAGLRVVLQVRGFTLTAEQEAALAAADPATLRRWLDAAATAETIEGLFG